jgi:predicted helicase
MMDLHVNYEQAEEYPLIWEWNPAVPKSWRVEKMVLAPNRASLKVNESLTLHGIPARCFEYRVGNRSALEWIIDQYQVTVDKRSGIVSDPNGWNGDEEYIARLVAKVVFVSMETVRLEALLATIPMECFAAFGDMPAFFDVAPQSSEQEEQTFTQPGTLWDI